MVHRHTRATTIGLAAPLFVGGWVALFLGAADYLPWLTSPTVVVGLGITVAAGLLLVRQGAIRPRQIVVAVFLGLIGFGLSLLMVLLAVLAIWFRPGGPVLP